MTPKSKIKPNLKANVGRTDGLRKKLAALPTRTWAIGGEITLVIVVVLFMLVPAQRKATPAPAGSGVAGPAVTGSGATGTATGIEQGALPTPAAPNTNGQGEQLAFIQAVRLQPPRPSRMDDLKAVIVVAPTAPKQLTYTFLWKVNDRIIEDATGDTLNLSKFRKRDLVAVTVTPHGDGTAGFAVESPVVAIHSAPPSLELKAMRQARKTGAPIELQLVGIAPDSEKVAFSLEEPLVPGMTIDKSSGKISWLLQPGQKGSFRFGAAIEDENGSKVTKMFDVNVD
jgi:hypothetical protein